MVLTRKIPALLAVAAAATALLLLAGCGGDSDDSTSTASTAASAPQKGPGEGSGSGAKRDQGAADHAGHGNGGEGKTGHGSSGSGGDANRHVAVAPLEVSGGGSAQFKVKGGDNSVQEYGEEASESELSEAAEVVHTFFVARVRGEWAKACSLFAASQRENLEKLAASSSQLKGQDCPAALTAITKQVSPALARQLTTVDAAALRHEGEQAFLIYTGPPGRTVYAMPLAQEDDGWKVAAISGAALPGA